MTDTPTNPVRARELEALAVRCEQASGPDKEADTLIYAALNGWPVEWRGNALVRLTDFYPIGTIDPGERNRWFSGHIGAPAFTASLDAAMTLVPENALALVRQLWDGPERHGYAAVNLYADDAEDCDGKRYVDSRHAIAATPALALCAASLRSLALKSGETE